MSFAQPNPWHSGNSFGPDAILRQPVEARRRAEPWGATRNRAAVGKVWGFEHGLLVGIA